MIFARAIRSKKIRRSRMMREEAEKEVLRIGRDVKKNYEAIVANWKHKPRFRLTFKFTSRGLEFTCKPEDDEAGQIFDWTDYGTVPHWIRAKNAPLLKFRYPYTPKTRPRPGRVQVSRGAGKAGPHWASKKEVWHPGTEPRDFTVQLSRYWTPEARRRINNAIRRARRRMER